MTAALADGVRLMAEEERRLAVDIGEAWWQDVDTPEMLAQAERSGSACSRRPAGDVGAATPLTFAQRSGYSVLSTRALSVATYRNSRCRIQAGHPMAARKNKEQHGDIVLRQLHQPATRILPRRTTFPNAPPARDDADRARRLTTLIAPAPMSGFRNASIRLIRANQRGRRSLHHVEPAEWPPDALAGKVQIPDRGRAEYCSGYRTGRRAPAALRSPEISPGRSRRRIHRER